MPPFLVSVRPAGRMAPTKSDRLIMVWARVCVDFWAQFRTLMLLMVVMVRPHDGLRRAVAE